MLCPHISKIKNPTSSLSANSTPNYYQNSHKQGSMIKSIKGY